MVRNYIDFIKHYIEKDVTKNEVSELFIQMERIETAFMDVFWNNVLERFNDTNKKLQIVTTDIESIVFCTIIYTSMLKK